MKDFKPARQSARIVTPRTVLGKNSQKRTRTVVTSKQHTKPLLESLLNSKLLLVTAAVLVILFGSWLSITTLGTTILPLEQPYSLVVVTAEKPQEPVYLIEFNPFTNRIDSMVLDGKKEVEVLGGYGKYSLGTIFPLLALDNRSQEFVTATYSLALEHLVDGVIQLPGVGTLENREDLLRVLRPGFSGDTVKVSRSILLRLWLFTADGQIRPQFAKDGFSEASTSDWQRAGQRCPIAVVNTTATPKLAAAFEQVLRRSGLLVVRVTNESLEKTHSEIYFDDTIPDCATIAARLRSILPSSVTPQANAQLAQQYRGGVVLFIGKDVEIDVTK